MTELLVPQSVTNTSYGFIVVFYEETLEQIEKQIELCQELEQLEGWHKMRLELTRRLEIIRCAH